MAEENVSELAKLSCVPCKGGVPPLQHEESLKLLEKLGGGWKLIENHHLEKEYPFDNFGDGLDFVIDVGDMAEDEGHHPDIFLTWGKVKLTIWTHKINGLTESDFILAAKIDRVFGV